MSARNSTSRKIAWVFSFELELAPEVDQLHLVQRLPEKSGTQPLELFDGVRREESSCGCG